MLQIENETQYNKIVEAYADMVYRIAFQSLLHKADAEDVTQEVFLKLIRHNKDFNDMEHLKAWLIRVTVNKCHDLKRAVFRAKEFPTDTFESLDEGIPTDYSGVFMSIDELPQRERNILYLHEFEGYTIKEIAKILGRNQNTIGSDLRRAKLRLRKILEEDEL